MIEVPADPQTGIKIGIAVVLGPGDAGKTTIAAALARDWCPAGLEEKMIVVGPVQKLAQLLHVPNHAVDTKDRKAQDAFFGRINETEGALLVVVDEADLYYSAGGRYYGSKEFQELVNIGRNFGKSLILVARGTSDLAKNTINQARIILMAKTQEPNLLDYAERYMDVESVGPGGIPDSRQEISELLPHEFIVWCPKMNPMWQGYAQVIGGQIYLQPAPSSTNPEASGSSTPDEAPTSPDATAPIPVAAGSSPTASTPTSATSTTPSGSGRTTG